MSDATHLIGGGFDGEDVEIAKLPRLLMIAEQVYERLDDPDTGEYLGGYALQRSAERRAE